MNAERVSSSSGYVLMASNSFERSVKELLFVLWFWWFDGLRTAFPFTLYKSHGFKTKSKPPIQTTNLTGYLVV